MKNLILKSFISLSVLSLASTSFSMQRPTSPLPSVPGQAPAMFNGQPLPALPPRLPRAAQPAAQQPVQHAPYIGNSVPQTHISPETPRSRYAANLDEDARNLFDAQRMRRQMGQNVANNMARRQNQRLGGVHCANCAGAGF